MQKNIIHCRLYIIKRSLKLTTFCKIHSNHHGVHCHDQATERSGEKSQDNLVYPDRDGDLRQELRKTLSSDGMITIIMMIMIMNVQFLTKLSPLFQLTINCR